MLETGSCLCRTSFYLMKPEHRHGFSDNSTCNQLVLFDNYCDVSGLFSDWHHVELSMDLDSIGKLISPDFYCSVHGCVETNTLTVLYRNIINVFIRLYLSFQRDWMKSGHPSTESPWSFCLCRNSVTVSLDSTFSTVCVCVCVVSVYVCEVSVCLCSQCVYVKSVCVCVVSVYMCSQCVCVQSVSACAVNSPF